MLSEANGSKLRLHMAAVRVVATTEKPWKCKIKCTSLFKFTQRVLGIWARQVFAFGKSRQVKTSNPEIQAIGSWARQVFGLGKARQVKMGNPEIRLLAPVLSKSLG